MPWPAAAPHRWPLKQGGVDNCKPPDRQAARPAQGFHSARHSHESGRYHLLKVRGSMLLFSAVYEPQTVPAIMMTLLNWRALQPLCAPPAGVPHNYTDVDNSRGREPCDSPAHTMRRLTLECAESKPLANYDVGQDDTSVC